MRYLQVWFISLLSIASWISAAEDTVEPLQTIFQWNDPLQLRVTEIALKNGARAEMSYVLDFRSNEHDAFRVKMTALEFISINGSNVTEEMRQQLRPSIESFEKMPAFIVDQQGQLIDIVGIKTALAAVGEMTGKSENDQRAALQSEEAQALLKAALSAYWGCWVASWIGFPAQPDEVWVEDFDEQILPGTNQTIKGFRKYSHLGKVSDENELVHLRIDSTMEDPSMTQAVKEMLTNMDISAGREPDPELDSIPNMIGDSMIEVKIDPSTLRPVWAKRSKTIRMDSDLPKYESLRRHEEHEYTFHWNSAQHSAR